MERCKHLNGLFIEFMDATHTRGVENGRMDKEGYNDIQNITRYYYRCADCQKGFKYRHSKSPLWLRRIYMQLGG